MLVVLDNDSRKEYAAERLRGVPIESGMCMEIKPYKSSRSLAQNRLHWLLMTAISQQMPSQMDQVWHSPESWHELFKRMFLGVEAFEVDGNIYKAPVSSRKLKTKAFSDFYTQCDVWAAEHGIMITGEI